MYIILGNSEHQAVKKKKKKISHAVVSAVAVATWWASIRPSSTARASARATDLGITPAILFTQKTIRVGEDSDHCLKPVHVD